MHECKNCGRKYEGNFCPECGTKCGEDKPLTDSGERDKRATLNMLWKICDYLPVVLFVLFSALNFAFFSAPIAKMDFGLDTGDVGFGNLYAFSSWEIPQAGVYVTALLVSAIISAVFAVFVSVIYILPITRNKVFEISGTYISLKTFLFYLYCAVYTIFFILALGLISEISEFDEGAGLISAGACPVCVAVFSILFCVFTFAGAFGARFLFNRYPFVGEKEKELRRLLSQQKIAEREKIIADFESPAVIEEMRANSAPIIVRGKFYNRVSSALNIIVIVFALALLAFSWFVVNENLYAVSDPAEIGIAFTASANSALLLLIGLFYGVVAVIAVLFIVFFIKANNWKPTKLCPQKIGHSRIYMRPNKRTVFFYSFALVLDIVFLAFYAVVDRTDKSLLLVTPVKVCAGIAAGVLFVAGLAGLISAIAVYRIPARLGKELYGTAKPEPNSAPIVFYSEEEQAEYERKYYLNLKRIKLYKQLSKDNSSYNVRFGCSKNQGGAVKRVLLACLAVCLITVISSLVLFAIYGNMFNKCYLKNVNAEYTRNGIVSVFGIPDDFNNEDINKSTYYEYYDGEYLKLFNKLKAMEEAENFGDEYIRLSQSALTVEHRFLRVEFGGKGTVSALKFDARYTDGRPSVNKVTEKVVLSQTEIERSSAVDGVELTCGYYYTDGSYKFEELPLSAYSKVDFSRVGIYYMEWVDAWGSYVAKITVV